MVTDEGLKGFEGKKFPITHLCLNGLSSVTGVGLQYPIAACKDTLQIYEGALMDQEGLRSADFGKPMSTCFQLESIDISGCHWITDEFFMHLSNGELMVEGNATKPGLQNLVTVKMSFLKNITDTSVGKVCGMSQKLEHLEIAGCE